MIFNVTLVGVILRKSFYFPTNKKLSLKVICKEYSTKSWNTVSICRLLKRFEADNSTDRRAGSGRQRTITTEENGNLIKNLFGSKEDNRDRQMLSRDVEKNTGISCISLRRMIKRRVLKQFKHLNATMTSSGTQKRQAKRARALAD